MINKFILLFIGTVCVSANNNGTEVNNVIGNGSESRQKGDSDYGQSRRYSAQLWDLNTRPLPEWYDRAKIGLILHWGVYSVPGLSNKISGSEWFRVNYMNPKAKPKAIPSNDFVSKNYRSKFSYYEFAERFTAEFFDPDKLSDMFLRSGAKYVVVTCNHHDGYALFPSKDQYGWRSVDVGPKRDIIAELAAAIKKNNITFGAYYSFLQWFNPLDDQDYANDRTYANSVVWPDIKQIVNDYKPSVVWGDGGWAHSTGYYDSANILVWLFNDSPVKDHVVVNDRWGSDTNCRYGSFLTCRDRFDPGTLQTRKWESVFSIDKFSWGYRHDIDVAQELLSIEEMLGHIVRTVSCGGNALINVALTSEGHLPLIYQDRLSALGDWLQINGEAIYGTSPWLFQNETSHVWFTCAKTEYDPDKPTAVPKQSDSVTAIYAIVLEYPESDTLNLTLIGAEFVKRNSTVRMLGEDNILDVSVDNTTLVINLPSVDTVKSKYAWVLKFS